MPSRAHRGEVCDLCGWLFAGGRVRRVWAHLQRMQQPYTQNLAAVPALPSSCQSGEDLWRIRPTAFALCDAASPDHDRRLYTARPRRD